ncbi:MAG: phosphoribosylglycinamide formyltransferase, partial [Bacteroidetes bacterium]
MHQSTTSSDPNSVKHNIAIFASGSGSNALKIIEYFAIHSEVSVALILTNREDAGVLDHAANHQIPSLVITKKLLQDEDFLLAKLGAFNIDFIVLAGFLLLIPKFLVEKFDHKMVNIHPALLPKYGGPGMYGKNVHIAVKEARETESGITIHFVNTKYDEGGIVFQHTVQLEKDDTPEEIASRV